MGLEKLRAATDDEQTLLLVHTIAFVPLYASECESVPVPTNLALSLIAETAGRALRERFGWEDDDVTAVSARMSRGVYRQMVAAQEAGGR